MGKGVNNCLLMTHGGKDGYSLWVSSLGILEEGRGSHFDPYLLDGFAKIAKSLYDEFAEREDDALKDQLLEITQHYFSEDAEIQLGGEASWEQEQ